MSLKQRIEKMEEKVLNKRGYMGAYKAVYGVGFEDGLETGRKIAFDELPEKRICMLCGGDTNVTEEEDIHNICLYLEARLNYLLKLSQTDKSIKN